MESIPPTPKEPEVRDCEKCGGVKVSEGLEDRFSPSTWCTCGYQPKTEYGFKEGKDEVDRDDYYD